MEMGALDRRTPRSLPQCKMTFHHPDQPREQIVCVWKDVRAEKGEACWFPNERVNARGNSTLQTAPVFKELWKVTGQGIVLLHIHQFENL